jgi:hypothetical protein
MAGQRWEPAKDYFKLLQPAGAGAGVEMCAHWHKEIIMKKVLSITIILTALCGMAGEYFTRSMGTSGVAVTNTQQNASWNLSAVAIRFGETLPVSTETVRVSRVSCGMEVVLGSTQEFGQSMVLTLPEELTFKFGDVVKVYGGGATGVVQVFTTSK